MVPMNDTTTADDIFSTLVGALDKVGADWTSAVSLATDGAPSMVGRKAGVATILPQHKCVQDETVTVGDAAIQR